MSTQESDNHPKQAKGRADDAGRQEREAGLASEDETVMDARGADMTAFTLDSGSSLSEDGSVFSNRVEPEPTELPRVEGYDVLEPLGRGGMGTVWRAVQKSTSREVALKLLGGAVMMSEQARPRFEREVKLAARLEHSNIATIYDSGLERGVYYYAMQLVDGEPMDAFVQRRGLKHKHILKLIQIVCSAVQHAHELGVVHRDLKPSNILVTESGKPIVLDFGLAKTVEEEGQDPGLTMSGDITGTPAYMAPEQAEGLISAIGPCTDVYALGAILYRLLVGDSPTDLSGTKLQVLMRIAQGEVRDPRSIKPAIDDELEAILITALAVKPEDRFESAQAMADAIKVYLKRLKAGEIVTASDSAAGVGSIGLTQELSALQTKVEPAGAGPEPQMQDLFDAGDVFRSKRASKQRNTKSKSPVLLIAGGAAALIAIGVVLLIVLLAGPSEEEGDGQTNGQQLAGLPSGANNPSPVWSAPLDAPQPDDPTSTQPAAGEPGPPTGPVIEPGPAVPDPSALRLQDPEPAPPAVDPAAQPEPEPALTARDVAVWVIESGGELTFQAEKLYPGVKLSWFAKTTELPDDLSRINGVKLHVQDQATLARLADLKLLTGMRALILECGTTLVKDADLVGLSELTNLGYLKIESSELTSASIDHVVKLTSLRALRLHMLKLDSKDLGKLSHLPRLEILGLRESSLDDAALSSIAGVRRLNTLDLWHCNGFTSEGVHELTKLRQLGALNLNGTGLDDAGMKHLERMRSLERLSVVQTRVTPPALVRFKRAVPGCTLFVQPNEAFQLPNKNPDRKPDRRPERGPDRDTKPPKPGR